ncbi:hypothetical protein A3C09_02805 [Candidatus Uhrbacteria bacterium RIFCSPHIGHO2_02_FULL_47_44]|uniref:FMN-binding domain-containing protein n=1 Tax=Candidatus Uhrbacteria bacterium RIFCSPLOWO2_02_FULL_48_18 TaxID=1802408 RepID=A0A1F7V6Z1_9BACT|nr:MAG: hypothetical protein A2839_01455 [Candidatus Uhrbacteria bacterium RIFCSPHIGHO2_01_FULL_47_10]OGL70227.1 MAG: hypothetical protein A3C09_02805 [Candidatus Uhrbacteria bacterium RIFCSPHIGHO2_02_FULL_47_44]OGL77249.1 MAG: hypothetical protein A3E97_01100 [Candidatus Uhrbacteria bacterium RIFCSPHIGHO2_12_FULL_47_12]OGL80476.1 MAG: hypothetical protein A3B20_03650 [Candidatus Uhrbacteria bacterium RIFCSPLOWO2_01_FULL_47_17]OGL86336.1 MAG: hypothetical protein A3I41_02130 [Candidatus Uhrbact
MEHSKNPTQKWIALIIVIVLLGGLIAFMMSRREEAVQEELVAVTEQTTPSENTQPAPVPEQPTPTPNTPAATPTTQKSSYKDGTYSATGNYVSPGGSESVLVTVVLKDDVVTDVMVSGNANNPTSKNWQARFISNIKAEVVGKKLDDIQLDVVSGSSLTPVGFMDALAKIKVQAKA